MKWAEVSSKDERREQIKGSVINKFKEIYRYSEYPLEFTLNDGSIILSPSGSFYRKRH